MEPGASLVMRVSTFIQTNCMTNKTQRFGNP
jgi:hypothetical protein